MLKATPWYRLGHVRVRFAVRWTSFLVGYEWDSRDKDMVLLLGPAAVRMSWVR